VINGDVEVSKLDVQQSSMRLISINSRITQIRGYILFLLGLLYLFNALTGWVGEFILLSATFFAFAVSLPFMNRLPQILSITMLALGHILYLIFGADHGYWIDALFLNIPFVSLFVFVPFLSIPLRTGGYVEFIASCMHKFADRPVLMHSIVATSTFIITSFMNIGSVRIMNELFEDSYKENREHLVKAVMQGFSLSAMFSPYIAGVAVVLYLLKVPLLSFLVCGVILVFLGLSLSIGITYFENYFRSKPNGKNHIPVTLAASIVKNERISYRKGIELLVAFIGLFTSFLLLEKILHIHLVYIVSLIALFFPLVWVVVLKKTKALPAQFNHYRKNVLPNVHNESIMIISASFFAKMAQLSPLPHYLSESITFVAGHSLLLALLAILLSILLLSLLGVHQILPITIYATSFSPAEMEITPVLLASVLAIGWAIGGLIAPVSSLNIVSGNLFGFNWIQLSRWNLPYIVLFIFFSSLFIYCLNLI
jgi:hypothetical protein